LTDSPAGRTLEDVQVIFSVDDLDRSLEFYERAFGWPRNDAIDYSEYVELLTPDGGALGLFDREGYAATVGAPPADVAEDRVAPSYLYVRVDDVRAASASLEAAGARRLSPLRGRSWGEEAAWYADPDGNVVAVGQPTATSSATTPG
jgi:catechol 2,3-dioxygenase-like lactoylglutathione lyase family enzyme